MEGEKYHATDLFPSGTIHHSAEIGSVKGIQDVLQQQKAKRGLPALVVLEQQDELLQCVPLHVAAERGHLEAVQFIISHDVDLDAADGHSVRPLHLAAINNHCRVVKALVDKGANVTKQDIEGDLPTHWAATKGHIQMLEMLLVRGAPIDGHNKQGWTALHRAAYNGRVDACRLLLRRGASIHAVTNTGATALHLAASNNHLGVMELLLQLGASTQMTDHQGATAADACIGEAARGLIAEKEAGPFPAAGTRNSSAQPRSRPDSRLQAARAAAAARADLTHVPHMPRYRPENNVNLDADGFPTSEAHMAGGPDLQAEGSGPDEGLPPDMLLLEGGEYAGGAYNEDGAASLVSTGLTGPYQAPYALPGSSSFSARPGELTQQSSKQQLAAQPLSASASFNKGSSSEGGKQQLQTKLSGKQRQAGPNQRFLKQYSLDKKGLFAP